MKKKKYIKRTFLLLHFLLFLPSLSMAADLQLSCPQGPILFKVEMAQTPADRAKGLMYRETLKENEGMLFHFPEASPISMWMKNTPLPLDMLFINAKGEILDIKENTTPYSLDPIGPIENTVYVLEVLGGTVKKRHISKSCTVVIED